MELGDCSPLSYHISGSVAKKRILPLLQRRMAQPDESLVEIDTIVTSQLLAQASSRSGNCGIVPRVDFVWENTPRKAMRPVREVARVYSHVANAGILEDKWALALLQTRVTEPDVPLLETHCLRGRSSVDQ